MINLLPPQHKKDLLIEETKRLVVILGTLFFLSLLALVLILLPIKIYISGELQGQQTFLELEQERLEVKEIQDLQERIKVFNKKLSLLDSFYEQKVNLATVFDKITKTIPQKTYLTDFSYSKQTSQITLSGFAPSRDILFQFKKNLEKDFQNVYFPPDNWVHATDINFSGVSFKINQ